MRLTAVWVRAGVLWVRLLLADAEGIGHVASHTSSYGGLIFKIGLERMYVPTSAVLAGARSGVLPVQEQRAAMSGPASGWLRGVIGPIAKVAAALMPRVVGRFSEAWMREVGPRISDLQ